jgi:hypothetical protein
MSVIMGVALRSLEGGGQQAFPAVENLDDATAVSGIAHHPLKVDFDIGVSDHHPNPLLSSGTRLFLLAKNLDLPRESRVSRR